MNGYKSDGNPLNDREQIQPLSNKKLKDVLIVAVLALGLIFASWKIFYADGVTEVQTNASVMETKVTSLLKNIEGVGDANVMICETEDGVQGVVVVCEGANDLHVVLNIREAVAAALGTNQNAVKVYLKKV